jgi:hypothetical protein
LTFAGESHVAVKGESIAVGDARVVDDGARWFHLDLVGSM